MWLRRSEMAGAPAGERQQAFDRLSSLVTGWALMSGYLGLEAPVEPRLSAAVAEVCETVFGDCREERDRLAADLARMDAEIAAAARIITTYRSGPGSAAVSRGRLLRRLRAWIWEFRDHRVAIVRCRRALAGSEKIRQRLCAVEPRCSRAIEWSERTLAALRSTYEFQRARAEMARRREEKGHDTRENGNPMVYRAS